MSSYMSIHPNNLEDKVTMNVNTFTKEDSGSDFDTIEIRFAGTTVTLFIKDHETLVQSLNNIIDAAQSRIDSLMTLEAAV